jgi:hypothetical protein
MAQQQQASSAGSSPIEVFEVFKVGNFSRTELQAIPDSELKKRFSLLSPVTSAEQLSNVDMLATLPKDGMHLAHV